MSVRKTSMVNSPPGRKKVRRGVACLLAFGLLFPSGAAIAAPEEVTVNDDAVVTETVDPTPVEAVAEAEPVAESGRDVVRENVPADEAPVNETLIEPAADTPADSNQAVVAATADSDALASGDDEIVMFGTDDLELCVAEHLGRTSESGDFSGGPITVGDMKSLSSLSCSNPHGLDATPVKYAINLTSLGLYGAKTPDLSLFTGMTKLEHLSLGCAYGKSRICNIVRDLSPLAGMKSLKSLNLGSNDIVDVSPLAGLTNLTSLDLGDNDVADVSPLAGLTNLTSLNLRGNDVDDVSPLASLTSLTTLNLSGNHIINASPLAALVNLTSLAFSDQTVRVENVTSGVSFALPKVRSIDGNSVPLTIDSGKGKVADETVTWNLPYGGNTRLAWSTNVKLPNITKDVTFSGVMRQRVLRSIPIGPGDDEIVKFEDPALEKCVRAEAWSSSKNVTIADMASLYELECRFKEITDIAPLQHATNLTKLFLDGNEITDISALAGLTSLETLDLGCFFDPGYMGSNHCNSVHDVSPLAGLTKLTYLDLEANGISDVSGLAPLTNLTHLDLSSEFMVYQTNSVRDLSPLAGLTKLTYLDLDYNNIVDVSPLAGLTNLTYLDLVSNLIIDPSPLAALTKLTYLGLDWNGIVDALPLAKLTNLESLRISGQSARFDDATSGVPFSMAKLRSIDGTPIPATIVSGKGGIANDAVTWNMPVGGEGRLEWSTTINLPKTTAVFDGSAYQKVLPEPGPIDSATPTISGTAQVGKKLTADPGKWTTGTAFKYQWLADGKAIKGATKSTYSLKAGELGKAITVTVTGSKTGYTTVSKTSAKTPAVAKGTLTAATPTITGTVKVGSTLTAVPGKWTSGTAFTYQWYAAGKAIKNATKSTFVLTEAQLGDTISVKVTGTKTGYTTASKTSAKTAVVAKGTLTTVTPTISGTVKVGSTLTANPGKWTSGTTFTYQWYASGKAIKGATKATFVLTATQLGDPISVKVTGSKTGYTTASKTSAKTGAVAKGTLTTATPTISGKAKVGEKLTAKPGKWTTGTTFKYQWLADGKAIKGATKSSYTLKAADAGKKISVKVTGTKSGYTTLSKTSKATAKVTPKA
ncbi:MAG: leucine-rich repeat domain-containing protein [Ancrocorticia sp.]